MVLTPVLSITSNTKLHLSLLQTSTATGRPLETLPLKNLLIALRTISNHVANPKEKAKSNGSERNERDNGAYARWEHRIEARGDTAVLRGVELEERRRAPTEETPA